MSLIAFTHPSLNKMGGAEKMALETIKILIEAGYGIHLYTIDPVNWELLEKKWGKYPRPKEEFSYIKEKLEPRSLVSWINAAILYLRLLIKTYINYPITINNYGEAMPYFSEITIFHAEPLLFHNDNPYEIPFWGKIKLIYNKITKKMCEKYCDGVFVTNSVFNAECITEIFGKAPDIIHPFIYPVTYYNTTKTGEILVIARLTPGKNLYNIIPLTLTLRKKQFKLMGQLTPYTYKLMKNLRDIKNLQIIKNPDRATYEQVLKESSIILSTQKNEAFGISLVEAMSAGCIPIVPREGGPWIDILSKIEGESGYGYSTINEAAEIIEVILSDENLREKLRYNCIKRARDFNFDRYRESILKLLNSIIINPVQKKDFYYSYKKYKDFLKRKRELLSRYKRKFSHKINNILSEIVAEYNTIVAS